MSVYLFVSSEDAPEAERAVAATPAAPDLCVSSPSDIARATAALAIGDRWVFTVEEPLLVGRALGESPADVRVRYAQALRGLWGYDTRSALVVCDELGILGQGCVAMAGDALLRMADQLDRS